jgi:hypothetical protein
MRKRVTATPEEVCALLDQGLGLRRVAEVLGIAVKTVIKLRPFGFIPLISPACARKPAATVGEPRPKASTTVKVNSDGARAYHQKLLKTFAPLALPEFLDSLQKMATDNLEVNRKIIRTIDTMNKRLLEILICLERSAGKK